MNKFHMEYLLDEPRWKEDISHTFGLGSYDKTESHEKTLIERLEFMMTNCPQLSDFTIFCQNGFEVEEFKTFRLILIATSKYYETQFRQEPDCRVSNLQFEAEDVRVVMKCLLRIPENFGRNLGYKKLLRILEITDYLQMDSLTSFFQLLLSAKFTKENIHEIANCTETFHVPDLHKKCCVFIREFIPSIEVAKISKTFLQNILVPSLTLDTYKEQDDRHFDFGFRNVEKHIYARDKYGRLYGRHDSETLVIVALEKLDPEKDWKIPPEVKKKMYFTLIKNVGSVEFSRLEANGMRKRLVEKYCLNSYDVSSLVDISNSTNLYCGGAWKHSCTRAYARAPSKNYYEKLQLKVLEGNFRKICVKTRLNDETQNRVVQGLKVEFPDGNVQALGMNINDFKDVTELEVPKDQHISSIFIHADNFIERIAFVTNKDEVLGPVGGTEDQDEDLESAFELEMLNDEIHAKAFYFRGFHCFTPTFEGEENFESYIANVQFHFVVQY